MKEISTLNTHRTWLVGASEAIGLAMVEQLLLSQSFVVASSRQAETNSELLKLKIDYPEQLQLLNCDVTKTQV